MRNVTIVLDDETARWARVEAARQDTSLSRFVGELIKRQMDQNDMYEQARRSWRSRGPEALQAENSPYPSRDELHSR